MQKISAGRGHQRLLQLARSQLGQEFATKAARQIQRRSVRFRQATLINVIRVCHSDPALLSLSRLALKAQLFHNVLNGVSA